MSSGHGLVAQTGSPPPSTFRFPSVYLSAKSSFPIGCLLGEIRGCLTTPSVYGTKCSLYRINRGHLATTNALHHPIHQATCLLGCSANTMYRSSNPIRRVFASFLTDNCGSLMVLGSKAESPSPSPLAFPVDISLERPSTFPTNPLRAGGARGLASEEVTVVSFSQFSLALVSN